VYGSGSFGVQGSGTNIGVYGTGSSIGVQGFASPSSGGIGVQGTTNSGRGGFFSGGASGIGVEGSRSSSTYIGVYGHTDGIQGYAVYGSSSGPKSIGVYGQGADYGGLFAGNVFVGGTLSKAAGSFKIDHPLDPENKYLSHSFVESPDMMNIYNGIAILDYNGEAIVEMPAWFEALNTDFRYQLTAVGAPGPYLYIAEKIAGNRFKIGGGQPGMEVSWQVTGIRQDAYANANRIKVEEDKPRKERGYYLHPELFGQTSEKGVEWGRHPEMMQRLKEEREKNKNQ